jgi:hypothetical protein
VPGVNESSESPPQAENSKAPTVTDVSTGEECFSMLMHLATRRERLEARVASSFAYQWALSRAFLNPLQKKNPCE